MKNFFYHSKNDYSLAIIINTLDNDRFCFWFYFCLSHKRNSRSIKSNNDEALKMENRFFFCYCWWWMKDGSWMDCNHQKSKSKIKSNVEEMKWKICWPVVVDDDRCCCMSGKFTNTEIGLARFLSLFSQRVYLVYLMMALLADYFQWWRSYDYDNGGSIGGGGGGCYALQSKWPRLDNMIIL